MSTERVGRRRLVVLVLAVVLAGAIAGSVVAGRMVWLDDAASLGEQLSDAERVKLAEIPAAEGRPARGVFAQVTPTGYLCVSEAPLAAPLAGGGGCNPADDPRGGAAVTASLSFDGGPAVEDVEDARLIGLVAGNVASARILMSDGTHRAVRITKGKIGADEFRAFGYRFRRSDLRMGVGPTAVVAYDAAGVELGRQTTGIG